ncbi:twin-arginine translocase subunit TatC [candidate division KSB1 bacterium]|nr:twin-arginine translocase subunit TatC [candidate division KSB1 bacterium]
MPFLDHLEELRWTIIRSLIAVMLTSIVSYIFSKEIITFLRSLGPEDLKLIFLAPTEGFMIYIKVSLWAGVVFAFPYIAYQFWQFVVPGLYEKEKKYVPHIAFFTTLCFVTGAAFASFIIIPFGMKFLLGFQTDFLAANITIGKYLGFIVTIILVFGVVFELPVLSYFLTKIGLLTPQFLQKNRRYGIVMIFIAAAVLTPPDVFTQLLLAGPLILLYEVSIWVSKAVLKKKSD